jgi:hypothetical protein
MPTIGFIAEGDTDRAVLENIFIGYFGEDISEYFTSLQPKPKESGGWSRVLNYCASTDFLDAFRSERLDFVVLHIDTDKSFEKGYDVSHDINGEKLSAEELVHNVKERFTILFAEAFGTDFFEKFGHKILFAISVHDIECWLLPLYYKDPKDKLELKNCYEKLNKKVKGLNKKYSFYDAISSDFRSNKKLLNASKDNPSFTIFLENELNIKIPINKK